MKVYAIRYAGNTKTESWSDILEIHKEERTAKDLLLGLYGDFIQEQDRGEWGNLFDDAEVDQEDKYIRVESKDGWYLEWWYEDFELI